MALVSGFKDDWNDALLDIIVIHSTIRYNRVYLVGSAKMAIS